MTAQVGTEGFYNKNSFDDIYPWSDFRIVNDSDNLLSITQEMVRIPKYYIKVYQKDGYEYWMVSKYQKEGYRVADFFKRANGTEADFYEIARYKTSNGRISQTGMKPDTQKTREYFRD